MPRIKNTYVPDLAGKVNERLVGLKIRVFDAPENTSRSTTTMLQLWDGDGAVEALCLGSQAECGRWLEGFSKALDITNR